MRGSDELSTPPSVGQVFRNSGHPCDRAGAGDRRSRKHDHHPANIQRESFHRRGSLGSLPLHSDPRCLFVDRSEGTGVEFSLDGTQWTEATEAHDLEDGSRHYSGIFSVARPEGLRWRPIGRGISDVTVDYLNTVDGPGITKVVPATAAASASTPPIVSREEWLADESIKKTSGGCKGISAPCSRSSSTTLPAPTTTTTPKRRCGRSTPIT